MNQEHLLSKIAVCLVDPTYAGNVGSVARAIVNMGFSRLLIVGGVDTDCEEAKQMASGNFHIIEQAKRFDSLKEAIAPFQIVAGTSRRVGKSRRPTHTARGFSEFLLPLLKDKEAVIVFGREKSGLTTQELDLCQYRVYIPSVEKHGSLNLSQAVMVILHELYVTALGEFTWAERRTKGESNDSKFIHLLICIF